VVTIRTDLPNGPEKRWRRSAIVINREMYVYNGSVKYKVEGDLWIFDLHTFQWSLIATDLPVRKTHTLLQVHSFIGVIGGSISKSQVSLHTSGSSRWASRVYLDSVSPSVRVGLCVIDLDSFQVHGVQKFGKVSNLEYSATVSRAERVLTSLLTAAIGADRGGL
jgi:hypothetical protein